MKNRMIASLGKLILGVALFGGLLTAQAMGQAAVPANTLKAFEATSGGAKATWLPGPNKSFEATFLKEGQKMVYVYDEAGLLQQKKIVSTVAGLPANVGTAVAAAYPKTTVDCAYKVVNRSNQKFYEVQVTNPAGIERMRFDLEGKPLGKTSLAAAQPAGTQPVAVVASQPVAKPAPSPAANPQPVATKPAPSQPVATKPAPTPAPAVTKPVATSQPTPAKPSQPIAMRGESTTTTKTTTVAKDDLIDDDLGDLLEDDGDMDDLLNDDDSWDDIDLGDDLDDDSDLLDGSDDLDDDLDLDDLDDDDEDLL